MFSSILDTDLKLHNPYLYLTKAEVVARVVKEHDAALRNTVSCWRSSRVTQMRHCGECVPCLIRRIAFEYNGLSLDEYGRNLLQENVTELAENDEGNLVDLVEFAHSFGSTSEVALEQIYPGLINEDISIPDAIAMYKRFAAEAKQVQIRQRVQASWY